MKWSVMSVVGDTAIWLVFDLQRWGVAKAHGYKHIKKINPCALRERELWVRDVARRESWQKEFRDVIFLLERL